ncbi:MAG: acetolactate synthase small subunit [Lentisphaeria bacterium]|nr:acetolactate synthase small subunit [Lentisphaeria bacterium]
MHSHTISVLMENKFGVLARIAGLFSGRGFNIDSLTVSPTQDESLSRMTIVTSGEDSVLDQIDKQLNKLVEVVKVTDLTGSGFVSRELMLVKVHTEDAAIRNEVIQITNIFKALVVNVENESLIIQVTGPTEKLDSFVGLTERFGIIELARTGKVALLRSSQATEMLDTNDLTSPDGENEADTDDLYGG